MVHERVEVWVKFAHVKARREMHRGDPGPSNRYVEIWYLTVTVFDGPQYLTPKLDLSFTRVGVCKRAANQTDQRIRESCTQPYKR